MNFEFVRCLCSRVSEESTFADWLFCTRHRPDAQRTVCHQLLSPDIYTAGQTLQLVWAGLPEINGHFLSFWNIDGEEGPLAPLDEILHYGARHRVIMAEEGHDHWSSANFTMWRFLCKLRHALIYRTNRRGERSLRRAGGGEENIWQNAIGSDPLWSDS